MFQNRNEIVVPENFRKVNSYKKVLVQHEPKFIRLNRNVIFIEAKNEFKLLELKKSKLLKKQYPQLFGYQIALDHDYDVGKKFFNFAFFKASGGIGYITSRLAKLGLKNGGPEHFLALEEQCGLVEKNPIFVLGAVCYKLKSPDFKKIILFSRDNPTYRASFQDVSQPIVDSLVLGVKEVK